MVEVVKTLISQADSRIYSLMEMADSLTIVRSESKILGLNKMVSQETSKHRFHKQKIGTLNLIETSNHRIHSTRSHMANPQQIEVELMRRILMPTQTWISSHRTSSTTQVFLEILVAVILKIVKVVQEELRKTKLPVKISIINQVSKERSCLTTSSIETMMVTCRLVKTMLQSTTLKLILRVTEYSIKKTLEQRKC